MKRISKATILVAVLMAAGLVTLYITQSRKGKEMIPLTKVIEKYVQKGKGIIPLTKVPEKYVRLQQPMMLTYDELVALGTSNKASGELGNKLHAITTTPFLSNEAYYRGAKPHRPKLNQLGSSLRLVTWNIERGLELDGIKLLFANTEEFLRQAERN